MNKVYAVSYNKPEFIAVQLEYLNRWCEDDFQLIVINNGIDQAHKNLIEVECDTYKLRRINVKNPASYQYSSESHSRALECALKTEISLDKSPGLTIIMDNDIFPYSRFSFSKLMNGNRLGGIYQQRKDHTYISAIFLMVDRSLDLSNFTFHQGIGDTGAAVQSLMATYTITPEFVNHTGQIDIETDHIFRCNSVTPYISNYRSQFIADSFFHYYRGSNWSESDPTYHSEKWRFTMTFLKNPDQYCLNLDESVNYPTAHSDKSYDGVDHNYHNYKFIEMRKVT